MQLSMQCSMPTVVAAGSLQHEKELRDCQLACLLACKALSVSLCAAPSFHPQRLNGMEYEGRILTVKYDKFAQ